MVLGIYGAGGLGREVYVLSMQINNNQKQWSRIVFIDDADLGESIDGIEIFSFENFCTEFKTNEAKICIAIGEPVVRANLYKKAKTHAYQMASLVHPSVFIPTSTRIGEGSIIFVGSFISCNVVIGENVLIQAHVNVGHDCIVDNDSVISGLVNIAGNCKIDHQTYIGLSACIKENTRIGANTIIGMGSVVVKDIPDNIVAFGNPAKQMKNNDKKRVFK